MSAIEHDLSLLLSTHSKDLDRQTTHALRVAGRRLRDWIEAAKLAPRLAKRFEEHFCALEHELAPLRDRDVVIALLAKGRFSSVTRYSRALIEVLPKRRKARLHRKRFQRLARQLPAHAMLQRPSIATRIKAVLEMETRFASSPQSIHRRRKTIRHLRYALELRNRSKRWKKVLALTRAAQSAYGDVCDLAVTERLALQLLRKEDPRALLDRLSAERRTSLARARRLDRQLYQALAKSRKSAALKRQ